MLSATQVRSRSTGLGLRLLVLAIGLAGCSQTKTEQSDSEAEISASDVGGHFKYLAELDDLVGSWSTESTGSDGTTSVTKQSFAWVLNKNFIQGESTIETDGRIVTTYHSIIGWDPEAQTVKAWKFRSGLGNDVTTTTSLWVRDGDAWVMNSKILEPDGSTTLSRSTFRFLDKDTQEVELTEVIKGGERLPIRPNTSITLHRIK